MLTHTQGIDTTQLMVEYSQAKVFHIRWVISETLFFNLQGMQTASPKLW